jgi:glucose dehydrogenase
MMVALDKKTGKEIWKCPMKDCRGAGHSSIVISKVGNRKVYVQTTASGAVGVDAASGKLLWSFPIDQTTAVIPTPIVRGDLVFFSAGYRRGGALLKQVATADGVKMEEIYGLKQDLANKHGGLVLVGDVGRVGADRALAGERFDVVDRRRQPVGAAADDHHGGTRPDEPGGDGLADSATAAGDQVRPVVKGKLHANSSRWTEG